MVFLVFFGLRNTHPLGCATSPTWVGQPALPVLRNLTPGYCATPAPHLRNGAAAIRRLAPRSCSVLVVGIGREG